MHHDPLRKARQAGTYLGFDYGTKRIGVAVGQRITRTASPLETIHAVNQKTNWEAITRLIETWQPCGLVVGVSHQVNGEENPVTPKIHRFCRQLEGRYGLPVYQVDEMLSTFESKQLLFDEVKVRASKLWEVQDQVAAQLILQTWLNQAVNQDPVDA